MTTYNSSMFINKQLNSLLNQSLPFDELVIVDDCSKDNTLDILKKFCDDNYNRNIKIFRKRKISTIWCLFFTILQILLYLLRITDMQSLQVNLQI